MLKQFLLASSMLIAAPAFAQDAPASANTQSQTQTPPAAPETAPAPDANRGTQGAGTVSDTAPGEAVDADAVPADPAPAADAAQPSPAPAQPAQPADAAPAPAQPSNAQPAPTPPQPGTATPNTTATAQPATTQDQVAQAVTRDFGTYDKDANGALSQAEFGAWMVTLRKASEPAFQPGTPAATAWLNQAFAATDADKNKTVTQAELTSFLTPKPS
jgi:hypothetical protein